MTRPSGPPHAADPLLGLDDPETLRHLLEAFVSHSVDGLFIKGTDGRYLFANAAAAAMVDCTPDALVGATDEAIFSPETCAEIRQRDQQVLESDQPLSYSPSRFDFGHRRVFQTTKYPYRDPQGRLVGVLGVSRDVTDLVETVRTAVRTSAGFERLLEALPDLVLVFVQGQVRYANPVARRLLGGGSAGPEGRSAEQLCPEGLPPGSAPTELRLLGDGPITIHCEAVLVRASWHGEPAHLLLGRDLGPRQAMQARMVRADRLAATGTLAAGLAHEINNPLTSLMLLLEEAQASPERSAALVDEALQCAERIATLVRELGSFARAAAEGDSAGVPRAAIEKAARMAAVRLKGRARLELDLADVPAVMGGGGGLWQVVLNLLVNASHAVAAVPGDGHLVRVRLRQEGAHARVEVEDTGPGIPPDMLEAIFEPFVSTRAAGEGTGLGLSIARSIVRDAGGTLTAENRAEGGGRFVVLLPLAHGGSIPTAAPPPPQPPPAVPELHDARILVVEDEAAIARALSGTLGVLGEVRVADTVAAACAALAEEGPFDLVLCDLVLPDGTGQQVHEHAAVLGDDLASRVVFVTGGAPSPELRAFVEASGCEVIAKPFSRSELVGRVARWLRQREDDANGR